MPEAGHPGNRTGQVPSTDSSTLYAWDAPGRMVSADVTAGIVSFTYNTDGQRVARQGTYGSATGFLYDILWITYRSHKGL